MNTEDDGFSTSYLEARTRWLEAVERHKGSGYPVRIDTRLHSRAAGPSGEALYMDIAIMGPDSAEKAFVISCGTHGIEGFTGSAVLSKWLEQQSMRLGSRCKLILIHAVNPWGFAHGQRVTEENVDLNRNFITYGQSLPQNARYAELHPHLMLDQWNEDAIGRAFDAMNAYRERHGEKAFSDAFNGGQYEFEDGIFFGGLRPQWSNITLTEVLQEHLSGLQEASLLDLHTGIGPYGEPFFINFDSAGSEKRKIVERIWGADRLSGKGSTHAAFATYQGLLIDAFSKALPDCVTSSVVVEFGTHPRPIMQRAHLALAWIRRMEASNCDSSSLVAAYREYRNAFIPDDKAWRQSVIRHGVELCSQGLQNFGNR